MQALTAAAWAACPWLMLDIVNPLNATVSVAAIAALRIRCDRGSLSSRFMTLHQYAQNDQIVRTSGKVKSTAAQGRGNKLPQS